MFAYEAIRSLAGSAHSLFDPGSPCVGTRFKRWCMLAVRAKPTTLDSRLIATMMVFSRLSSHCHSRLTLT